MSDKKPTTKKKARIKTVVDTMKESTILLQQSKSKIVVKVSVVLASILGAIGFIIEIF